MPRTASERLRRGLVADLRAKGVIRSDLVEAAFLAVPREHFVSSALADCGLGGVYRDEAIVTKRDSQARSLSSSSQPALMAEMLELLDLRPGHRVLEVGAGTGYNAALLKHIVGSEGRITSVDIDATVARAARRALRQVGYRASVIAADGRLGYPAGSPYDRIIVTACADEIPSVWSEQLADGGRLVLPLRLDPDGAAIQLIPALEKAGSGLRSVGLTWGGFMPLHSGDGGWRPPTAALSAGRSGHGRHTPLTSLSGAGLARLSARAARQLLASTLTRAEPPRRQGMTGLSSSRPPLLLVHLLLNIPAARRVSSLQNGRLGVGTIHPRGPSLAVVSVRSPWAGDAKETESRARWRLDCYGDDAAAIELEQLLDDWFDLQRTQRTTLRITSHRRGSTLAVKFAWSHGYSRRAAPRR